MRRLLILTQVNVCPLSMIEDIPIAFRNTNVTMTSGDFGLRKRVTGNDFSMALCLALKSLVSNLMDSIGYYCRIDSERAPCCTYTV